MEKGYFYSYNYELLFLVFWFIAFGIYFYSPDSAYFMLSTCYLIRYVVGKEKVIE